MPSYLSERTVLREDRIRVQGVRDIVGGAVMEITAAVAREKEHPFSVEELELQEPRADEVLVRVVGAGMCHTDLLVRDHGQGPPFPAVLGHEGAGVVER